MLDQSPFDNQAHSNEDAREYDQRQACDDDLIANRVRINVVRYDARRREGGGPRILSRLQ